MLHVGRKYENLTLTFTFCWGKTSHKLGEGSWKHGRCGNPGREDLNLEPGTQWMPLDESMLEFWRWHKTSVKKVALDGEMKSVLQPEETVCWKLHGLYSFGNRSMFPVAQDILYDLSTLLELCEGFRYSPMFHELKVDSNDSGSVPSRPGLTSMLAHV